MIREAVALFDRFARMVRGRTSEQLERWLGDAASSGIAEMEGFVTKLKQDLEAVEAALSTEWSQGQVEGQITRLKLIRRQVSGRGKFDLVGMRVLRAAWVTRLRSGNVEVRPQNIESAGEPVFGVHYRGCGAGYVLLAVSFFTTWATVGVGWVVVLTWGAWGV